MTIKERLAKASEQELLTVEEVSLLTRCHLKSIYRMVKYGRLSAVRVGRCIRIPKSCVQALQQHIIQTR